MERLPRRTPAAQMDIVGLVFDALADAVSGIPIIGDIVGFISSLFGNSSASNARIARLETIVSKGSSGYDDFNRSDTGSALGRGPQMPADWVQGGNGEQLRISGRAARLVEGSLAPSQGRRWARYPTPASSSTMTADTICDDKNIDTSACTTLIVCANEAFTEGVYANVFGTGVYLGKFTRSGTTWSFTDFPGGSNPVYKIGTAERIELRASGSGLYQLVVENSVVVEAEDTSFPIDAAHRYCGFAIQMNIPFPFNYQYGWGLSAFSMKSEAGTFTAIETVETIANGAQTAANNAVSTAVTEATAAANAAVGAVQDQIDTGLAAVNNRIDTLAGGVVQYTFSTSGTFTKPEGMTRCQVSLIGGSAGGSRYTRQAQPAGGCGGWTPWEELLASEVAATETVIVGAGGAGGTADGQLGGNGGASSFGSILTVGGGQCTTGGAVNGFGTALYYSGQGGAGAKGSSDPAQPGGNGPYSAGGIAGTTASKDGGNGAAPAAGRVGPGSGGGGGGFVTGASGNGGNGGYPGGGAGAGGNFNAAGSLGNGGNGAPGLVVVRCYFN